MYAFTGLEEFGGLSDLTSLVGGVTGLVRAFSGNGGLDDNGGFFDIPGIDIQSPIKLERNGAACEKPFFKGAAQTGVRPQPFCIANPGSGKTQWFVPARIKAFEMTHVRKPRRRCRCRKR